MNVRCFGLFASLLFSGLVAADGNVPGLPGLAVQPVTQPAVEQAKHETGDLLANAVNANVLLTVERLKSTAILSDALAQNTLKIVGGRYDLASGAVEIISA